MRRWRAKKSAPSVRTWRGRVFLFAIAIVVFAAHSPARPVSDSLTTKTLAGWQMVADGDELATTFTVADGVTVHVRAPRDLPERLSVPTRLVFYALPNGNSIAWTVGKRLAAGDDWHFGIQQIGAQTRYLRRLLSGENVVVAYLEAPGRSWPAWRRQHGAEAPRLAKDIVDAVAGPLAPWKPRLELTAHSGGGSFLFAYIESDEEISTHVQRLVFLDANYGFAVEQGHGHKLAAWLKEAHNHVLVVAAYDDRSVMLDGKPVVGPTGGTWRATERMVAALAQNGGEITTETHGNLMEVRGFGGRLRVALHKNPEKRILHTVLVERSGFVWGLLAATEAEIRGPTFFSDPAYLDDLLP